jgi:hypothetical protein
MFRGGMLVGSCMPGEPEKRAASTGDASADHIGIKTADVIVKTMEEANR